MTYFDVNDEIVVEMSVGQWYRRTDTVLYRL